MADEQQGSRKLSRRQFLKGATAATAGAVAATTLGSYSPQPAAAATQAATPVSPSPAAEAIGGTKYEVINTDILIIGAGFGATAAAFEALAKGQNVTMVDKGPFPHGGGHGFNWDVIATWVPDKTQYGKESYLPRVVNQELFYKADMSDPNQDLGLTYLNRDQCLPDRADNGKLNWYVDYPFIRGVQGVFPRFTSDALAKSSKVTIVDLTMITDLFINDGKCLGAMGVYLPTGDLRVFRAKATIVGTGPACWIYGWNTVQANSINTPDNTGDVEMAAFRHGAGIGDSEYASYDFATTYPAGLGYGWNTMLNPDANEFGSFADKNGKQLFTKESGIDLQRITYDRTYFNTELAKLMLAGAMTEEGGLLANLKGVHLRPAMANNLSVFAKFGVDPNAKMLPIHDEIYDRGGAPVITDTLESEEIKGVFFVRGAGVGGSGGGSNVNCNNRFGSYALRSALAYIESAPAIKKVDWSPADAEYTRLHELRTRQVKDGLRPHVVRHKIQKACGTCLGILRQKDKLEAAAKELARIRAEDMPKMIVTSSSPTYNVEWKQAIENYNLLDAAELAVNATLTRQESRGTYMRPDFPKQDDANWKVMLVGKLENGKFKFSKKTMPEHKF